MNADIKDNRASAKSVFETLQVKRSNSVMPDFIRYSQEKPSREKEGLRKKQILTVLLIWVIAALLVIWVISSYFGMDKWDRVAYIGIMFVIFHLFLGLDNFDKFHHFHRSLEGICNGKGQMVFGVTFLVLGFVDYILIEIYYDLLQEDGPLGLYLALYILYYICLILMFFNFMVF